VTKRTVLSKVEMLPLNEDFIDGVLANIESLSDPGTPEAIKLIKRIETIFYASYNVKWIVLLTTMLRPLDRRVTLMY